MERRGLYWSGNESLIAPGVGNRGIRLRANVLPEAERGGESVARRGRLSRSLCLVRRVPPRSHTYVSEP